MVPLLARFLKILANSSCLSLVNGTIHQGRIATVDLCEPGEAFGNVDEPRWLQS